jgi:hypothetical protein
MALHKCPECGGVGGHLADCPLAVAPPVLVLPRAISAVAWLSLMAAVIGFFADFFRGFSYLDLSPLLNLGIFAGLRSLSRGWWMIALVCSSLALLAAGGSAFVAFFAALSANTADATFPANMLGATFSTNSPSLALFSCGLSLALAVWQMRVLIDSRTTSLFFRGTTS